MIEDIDISEQGFPQPIITQKQQLLLMLEDIYKERSKNERNISLGFIGYYDENGELVCKGWDMFNELMKKECENFTAIPDPFKSKTRKRKKPVNITKRKR